MEEIMQDGIHPYDASKAYEWKGSDDFNLKGIELEFLYKTIAEILATPEAQAILKFAEMYRILEQKIKEGVEKGVITSP